jgi:hypothetical protein
MLFKVSRRGKAAPPGHKSPQYAKIHDMNSAVATLLEQLGSCDDVALDLGGIWTTTDV